MKKTLIILLLANVILFVSIQMDADSKEKNNTLPPLNESQIRLVQGETVSMESEPVTPEKNKTATKQENSEQNTQNKESKTETALTTDEVANCMEWGEFSGTELVKAAQALSSLKLGERLSERDVEYETSYWVYMPPLKDKRAVNKKIREIRNLGIREYFVVGSNEKWANAISLGVFKTQEAAENHLKQLRTQGIRTAIVGERGTKLRAKWFIVDNVDSAIKRQLLELQREFESSELQNVTCALTKAVEIGKMPRSSR